MSVLDKAIALFDAYPAAYREGGPGWGSPEEYESCREAANLLRRAASLCEYSGSSPEDIRMTGKFRWPSGQPEMGPSILNRMCLVKGPNYTHTINDGFDYKALHRWWELPKSTHILVCSCGPGTVEARVSDANLPPVPEGNALVTMSVEEFKQTIACRPGQMITGVGKALAAHADHGDVRLGPKDFFEEQCACTCDLDTIMAKGCQCGGK